jgi:hypothetical protein
VIYDNSGSNIATGILAGMVLSDVLDADEPPSYAMASEGIEADM